MDNRYASCELAVILREKCGILMAGTMKSNRKGFDKELFTMTKSNSNRGEYKFYYDRHNKKALVQWHDNRIVNIVSSLGLGKVEIKRRVGSQLREYCTEKCVVKYQKHMGGVDRGDQIRQRGSGFCRKAHFKKWYKKSFFAILDFMLLNSYTAWQMASNMRKTKINEMRKCDFYACVAEELLSFSHAGEMPSSKDLNENNSTIVKDVNINSHVPWCLSSANENPFCIVCKLEKNLRQRSDFKCRLKRVSVFEARKI